MKEDFAICCFSLITVLAQVQEKKPAMKRVSF